MKKCFSLFIIALAVFSLASCNKDGGRKSVQKPGTPVEVTISIRGTGAAGTKATGVAINSAAGEAKVNGLQVFVFLGDKLEAYRSIDNAESLVVPATAGERTIWAVVNAPSLESVESLAALKAATSRLSDNGLANFVMAGSTTAELTDGGIIPVTVRRLVSRVSISKISTALESYRENFKIDIKGIYLINVPANASLDLTAAPSLWVNKLRHQDSAYDALLYDGFSTPARIWNGHPYSAEHVFYPYPNTRPNASQPNTYESTWSPRGTLLVIEADMLDNANALYRSGYYPIILPALERNKTYTISEVCISRLPGENPWEPIVVGDARVTITVHDWETGANLGTINI